MISIIFYLHFIAFTLGQFYEIPVTFYLGKLYQSNPNDPDYFEIKLCQSGLSTTKQATLSIAVPSNPSWNPLGAFICIQLSSCAGDFSGNCTFATNYIYKDASTIATLRQITFNLNSACENVQDCSIYIRTYGFGPEPQYSFEVSFTNNEEVTAYNYTTQQPFPGDRVTKTPTYLYQYWKSAYVFDIPNNEYTFFALAYCDNGLNVDGINVAILSPNSSPYGLFYTWACPQNIQYTQCTQEYARGPNAWFGNGLVSSYNQLQCTDTPQTPTDNGIFVVLVGDGAEVGRSNQVLIQGEQIIKT